MQRTAVGLIAGLAVVAWCTHSARADMTAHVLDSITVGYNDNVLGTPSNPAPGQPTPLRTWFLQVSPGLTVFHESPLALHQFTYTHPMAVFFASNALDTSGDIVSWRGLFTLSPRDELTIGANVTRSRVNAGVLRNAVGQDATTVVPAGAGSVVSVGANQSYGHDFTPHWHGLQTAAFSGATYVGSSSNEPNHYLLDASGGAQYTEGNDGFGLVLNGGWFFTPVQTTNGVQVAPRQDQLNIGADAQWSHDWSPRWSTRATAGTVASADVNDVRHPVWSPVWSGGVFFFTVGGSASLIYARTIVPNVFVGQEYRTDQVTLTGNLPLSRRVPIVLSSSLAGANNHAIDLSSQTPVGSVRSASGDVSLSWLSPIGIDASIRYQHYRQYGNSADIAPLPTFYRDVVQLTIGGMFPPRLLPVVPGGPPVRVDGSDRTIMAGETPARPRPRDRGEDQ